VRRLHLVLGGRQRWLVAGALIVLLAAAGAAAWRVQALRQLTLVPLGPPDAAVRPAAPPERKLSVHVAGAVQRPGVYELPAGSRVRDALLVAGGATEAGVPQTLNLASFVTDGDKLFVPTEADLKAALSGKAPPEAWAATRSAPPLAAGGLRVDLNRADRTELLRLPGMTSAMATGILKYRVRHGRFERPEELQQVPGIDPATYDRLQPHVYVA